MCVEANHREAFTNLLSLIEKLAAPERNKLLQVLNTALLVGYADGCSSVDHLKGELVERLNTAKALVADAVGMLEQSEHRGKCLSIVAEVEQRLRDVISEIYAL